MHTTRSQPGSRLHLFGFLAGSLFVVAGAVQFRELTWPLAVYEPDAGADVFLRLDNLSGAIAMMCFGTLIVFSNLWLNRRVKKWLLVITGLALLASIYLPTVGWALYMRGLL